MSFFQNVFDQEFQGYLVLGDRQASITYKVPANKNAQTKQIAWNAGPYNFSTSNTLTLNYSWDKDFKIWSSVSINVAGSNPSSTRAIEVANALNSDPTFSELLTASVVDFNNSKTVTVSKNVLKKQDIKLYFSNTGAESILKFNKYAGVAELPSYFERHTISNRYNFPDSLGILIKLDTSDSTDENVVLDAGFVLPGKEDYEILKGRSGLFTFQNITVDENDRITQIIEYPAGAVAGDFARKINYTYSGSNINPSKVTEIPYVLDDGDLVTP
jgi:hypothetical protein